MKCPTPCPCCDEVVELHTMKTCPRCQLLVCDECIYDGSCLGCDSAETDADESDWSEEDDWFYEDYDEYDSEEDDE